MATLVLSWYPLTALFFACQQLEDLGMETLCCRNRTTCIYIASNLVLPCRAAASSSHASRAQPMRLPEVATTKPPSGLSGSVGQQQQAAALQQQIMQQLQMRRAAQYGARGGEHPRHPNQGWVLSVNAWAI